MWLRVFAGLALLATLMMVPVRGFDDAMQICFALGGASAVTLPRLGGSSGLQR